MPTSSSESLYVHSPNHQHGNKELTLCEEKLLKHPVDRKRTLFEKVTCPKCIEIMRFVNIKYHVHFMNRDNPDAIKLLGEQLELLPAPENAIDLTKFFD